MLDLIKYVVNQFAEDKENVEYIVNEKGLLVITLYFMVSGFAGGGYELHLPFFRNNAEKFLIWGIAVETLYALVSNFGTVGRVLGGIVHYKIKLCSR